MVVGEIGQAGIGQDKPEANKQDPLRVVVLGCGTVGAEVIRLLDAQAAELTERVGAPLELVGVGVRDGSRDRPGIDPELITTDVIGLVTRDDVDIVVELVGGVEHPRAWLTAALKQGKSVVTANQSLLAEDGGALPGDECDERRQAAGALAAGVGQLLCRTAALDAYAATVDMALGDPDRISGLLGAAEIDAEDPVNH